MEKNLIKKIANKVTKDKRIKKNGKGVCIYCGCNNPLIMTVDHQIPKIRGGNDDENNLKCTCLICNQLKGALTDKEFIKYMKALVILKDLCKISIDVTTPNIIFTQWHYPGYFQKKLKKISNKENKK